MSGCLTHSSSTDQMSAPTTIVPVLLEDNDKKKATSTSNEDLAHSRWSIIIAIVMYSLCSASLLLINKVAVESLPSVSFVLVSQFAFSVVVVKLVALAGYIELDPIEFSKVKQFIGVSFLFACCLFTNVKALQYANVETIIVFRSCSPIAVTVCDYFFLQRDLPSLRSWFALFSIVLGSVLYVYFDKQFEVNSYLWTSLCVFFLLLSANKSTLSYFNLDYVAIVSEMVYVKYVINEVKMTTWGRVYYNNLLSIPFVLVFGFLFNDHIALLNHEWDMISGVSVFLSCVVGIGISYTGFNLRDLVTATSFTVIGVVNKLATTTVNALMWDKHADVYGIGALIVCIAGGSLYQQSGKRPS